MRHQHSQSPFQAPDSPETNRFSLGLGDDSKLEWAKVSAGVLSVIALIAMLVTSLFRAPSPAPTVVLAMLAAGLSVAIGAGIRQRRGDRRR